MKNKSGFISLTWSKKIFGLSFRLFGLDFSFKINRKIFYSTETERVKLTKRGLKTGEVGELYGVRFVETKRVTKTI